MNKITLQFCGGTACHMKGAPELMAVLELLPEQITSQLHVSLTHCLENCGAGPNVRIGGVVHSRVTPESLIAIIKNLAAGQVK
ncbi:MAG: NADH-quinone oxidoreductase subunit E [Firmicutes bacterium]|nr:NADH-quinone oxidoreductase subunit E [candidate division NPL-UPA2 bacterium]